MEKRVVKFRGKRIDNGEWIEGEYFDKRNDGKVFLRPANDMCIPIQVDPETVGEFTGLRDKNGRDIYEGDVIRSMFSDNTPCLHEIRYDESLARFSAFYLNSIARDSGSTISQSWINDHGKEVIGNIYQHPNLLTETTGK